jgi:uncharacterized protein YeaO (DUF488 family)
MDITQLGIAALGDDVQGYTPHLIMGTVALNDDDGLELVSGKAWPIALSSEQFWDLQFWMADGSELESAEMPEWFELDESDMDRVHSNYQKYLAEKNLDGLHVRKFSEGGEWYSGDGLQNPRQSEKTNFWMWCGADKKPIQGYPSYESEEKALANKPEHHSIDWFILLAKKAKWNSYARCNAEQWVQWVKENQKAVDAALAGQPIEA